LSYQHQLDNDIPSVDYVVSQVFEKLVKNKSSDVLSQRIKHVVLSVYFDVLKADELSPEVKLAMQAELLNYQNWLAKKDRSTQGRVMLKFIEHYWRTNEWLGSFKVKQMPPGSPI
jgi:hypothetical protein